MKIKNKLGLLAAVMLLGVCTFTVNAAYSEPATEGFILTAQDSDEEITNIKANKETLENAKSEMANKNYESAITYLNAYIDGKSKKYEAYKLRGECYYALRQYDLAQKDFQTAIDLKSSGYKLVTGAKVVGAVVLGADKNDQYQNTELGNLYGELMYAQKALNDPEYENSYQKAFEYNSHIYLPKPNANDILKINCPQKYGKILNPQGGDADIMAVITDIENGDYHEAAYKLPNLASQYPNYYLTHYLTGVVMAGLERENQAIPAFEKALQLNPNDFESLASLGQIYYSLAENNFSKSDATKSVNYFKQAQKFNPNMPAYNYYIGLNNLILKNNDAAISAFDKAVSQRANDYNSMYYKAVAQQMKGDYAPVIDGATKLLNKHVSNYNSVLYLRALAYSKSGNSDKAMEDIETIFSNIGDIYNADIKTVSAKEKTLENYVHYLKAQILSQKGTLAGPEYSRAYQNPVIKTLANDKDYSFTMSPADLESQYDYMRTTFSNLGDISFNGNDYVITSAQPTPVYANYTETVVPKIQKNTEVEADLTPSLAQMLAMPSYLSSKPQTTQTSVLTKTENKTDVVTETTNITPNNTLEGEGLKIGGEPPISRPTTPAKGEPMIFTADGNKVATDSNSKPTDTFTITYNDTTNKTQVQPTESTSEEKPSESFKITYKDDSVTKPIAESTTAEKDVIQSAKEQKQPESALEVKQENKQPEPIIAASEPSEELVKVTEESGSIAAGIAAADSNEAKEIVPKITLRQSSSPEELLLQNPKEDSMAQMLAVQSIFNPETFTPYDEEAVKISGNVKTDTPVEYEQSEAVKNVIASANNSTIVSAPTQNETVEKGAEQFTIRYEDKVAFENDLQEITEPKVVEKAQDTVVQQKEVNPPILVEKTPEPVITVAKEVKETPDFTISYNDSPNKIVDNSKQDDLQRINEETKNLELQKETAEESLSKTIARAEADSEPNTVESVADVSKTPAVILPDLAQTVDKVAKTGTKKVVEKYANVDLSEYNIQKPQPVINEGDEVIVFEPNSSVFTKKEKMLASQNTNINTSGQITDNFSQLHKSVEDAVQKELTTASDEVKQVKETTTEQVAKQEEKIADNTQEKYEEPELIFPETVQIEKETKVAQAEVPTVVPKIRTEKQEQQVTTEVTQAQTASETQTVQDDKWLSDILDKAEKTPEKPKTKSKKEKSLDEFLTDEFDEGQIAKEKAKRHKKIKKTEEENSLASILKDTTTEDIAKPSKKKKRQEITEAETQEPAITVISDKPKKKLFAAKDESIKLEQQAKKEAKAAEKAAQKQAKAEAKKIKAAEKAAKKQADAELKASEKQIKEAERLEAKELAAAQKAEAKKIKEAKKLADKKAKQAEKEAKKAAYKTKKEVIGDDNTNIVKWFKNRKKSSKVQTEKNVKEVKTAQTAEKETVKKEKKEFQWWWKKNKSAATNESATKEVKIKKEGKKFSWGNIFKKKETSVKDTAEKETTKKIIKKSK